MDELQIDYLAARAEALGKLMLAADELESEEAYSLCMEFGRKLVDSVGIKEDEPAKPAATVLRVVKDDDNFDPA